MLSMTILLFPINNNKRTIINRRPSNIISNISGSTRIPRRKSTIPKLKQTIRRLLSMTINLTNIRTTLNSNSRHFTTTILQRTRRHTNITLNRIIIRRGLPLIYHWLRRPRLINGNKLHRTRALNNFNLNTIPRRRRVPRPLHLLGKVRINALSIFRRARHDNTIINVTTRSNKSNNRLYRLANTRPPLPYRRLMTLYHFTRHSQLRRAIFPSTLHRHNRLLLIGTFTHLGKQ